MEDVISIGLIRRVFKKYGNRITQNQAKEILIDLEGRIISTFKRRRMYESKSKIPKIDNDKTIILNECILKDTVFINNARTFLSKNISSLELEDKIKGLPTLISEILLEMVNSYQRETI